MTPRVGENGRFVLSHVQNRAARVGHAPHGPLGESLMPPATHFSSLGPTNFTSAELSRSKICGQLTGETTMTRWLGILGLTLACAGSLLAQQPAAPEQPTQPQAATTRGQGRGPGTPGAGRRGAPPQRDV